MIWQAAGVTGLDPMPRTAREMAWAYRGRAYLEYEQTAEIWAIIAEVNRDRTKRARPFTAADKFSRPESKPKRPGRLTAAVFRGMKGVFTKPLD